MSRSTYYRRRARLNPFDQLGYELVTSKSSKVGQTEELNENENGIQLFVSEFFSQQ